MNAGVNIVEPFPAVVIGASVGAIEALSRILPLLPADYPFAVMVVVHLPRQSRSLLSAIFAERCLMSAKEAEDKEALVPGTIYFAAPDYHLLVNPDFTLALSSDEPVHYSRPSVDVLFESAAAVFGDALTGVILTGSNEDGAAGLAGVVAAGGRALVQHPSTAEGRNMPASAIAACPETQVMDLDGIAAFLAALKPGGRTIS
ncbi:MAG: chemotaxis protein CheB [Verrucomicrobiaceae bacterium]|nr:MAG: chemotaxis protein CheB [Verrucomicrobiaceae bacterium]